MRTSILALILILGAAMLGSCGPALTPNTSIPSTSPTAPLATPNPSDTPAPTDTQTDTSIPTSPLPSPTAALIQSPTLRSIPTVILRASPVNPITSIESLVAQARTDLATRRGVAESAINVISAQTVEWPDGSLGCPKPGFMYPQIVTPGVLIVLQANGQDYEYHGTRTRVSLCEKK